MAVSGRVRRDKRGYRERRLDSTHKEASALTCEFLPLHCPCVVCVVDRGVGDRARKKVQKKKIEKAKNCPRGLVTLDVDLSQPGQCRCNSGGIAVPGSVATPGAPLPRSRKCAENARKIRRRLAQNPLPISRPPS